MPGALQLGYTGKMTIPRLPLERALAEYKITPECLWVWFVLHKQGSVNPHYEIRHSFDLSQEGQAGVKIIHERRRAKSNFLGCFSLPALEELLAALLAERDARAPRLIDSTASFLRIKRDFVVIVRQGDREFGQIVTAFTLNGAMDRVRQEFPSAVVAFGGDLTDLEALVKKMQDICALQDFSAISRDLRDPINGWLAQDLLLAARHPHLRAGMERFTEPLVEESNG